MNDFKLNLGSGKDYIKGYINVDIDPALNPDIIADLNNPLPFANGSAKEIKAFDVLEHFTKEQGEKFLHECWRVLKKGGQINIRVPNVFFIFNEFKNDKDALIHFLYGDTKTAGVYGAHKFGYTKESIEKLLAFIGFSIESFKEETTNFMIVAKKEEKKAKKLKMAIIQQSPDLGGAETYMLNMIEQFKLNGNYITLFTNKGKYFNEAVKQKIDTKEIPFFLDIIGNYRGLIKSLILLPYAIFFYTKVLSMLKKESIDLILLSGFSEKALVTFLSVFFKIPVFWVEYGPLTKIFKRNFYLPKLVYRLIKKIPAKIIVPSTNTARSLIQEVRPSFSQLELIPCGIKINTFKPSKNKEFIVGNVSRMTREKGQDILIKAFSLLSKKAPKAKLLLVGEGFDKQYFIDLAEQLEVRDKVVFTGFSENIEKEYAKMSVFVFPSVWDLEGFGLVMLEAMAHKIPVISTAKGAAQDIIQNNKTGYIVNPDPQEIAEKILFLINNPKEVSKIGNAGYAEITKYNIKEIAARYLNAFRQEL